MLCYYGDDMEAYRRWENNIKTDFKEKKFSKNLYIFIFCVIL